MTTIVYVPQDMVSCAMGADDLVQNSKFWKLLELLISIIYFQSYIAHNQTIRLSHNHNFFLIVI